MQSKIQKLPELLDSNGMGAVLKVFGEGVARPFDWKNILPDVPAHLATMMECILLGKPAPLSGIRNLLGEDLIQALVEKGAAKLEGDSFTLKYRLLSYRGKYFFINDFTSVNYGDAILNLLRLRPSFSNAKSFAVLCSGSGIECIEAARHSRVFCHALPGQSSLVELNSELNGIQVDVSEKFSQPESTKYEAIIAAPPFLLSLDPAKGKSNLQSGPLGSEYLQDTIRFIGKHLSDNGHAFVVGVSYGEPGSPFDATERLIKEQGLGHISFMTTRMPVEAVFTSPIFHQTISAHVRLHGGEAEEWASKLTEHAKAHKITQALLFSSLLSRDAQKAQSINIASKYYGLWTV